MKPMQGISVEPDFSWRIPEQRLSAKPNRWRERTSMQLARLAARRRELIFTALATVAIGAGLLLILLFVLGRNVVRVLMERRRGVLGVRLRVVAMSALDTHVICSCSDGFRAGSG